MESTKLDYQQTIDLMTLAPELQKLMKDVIGVIPADSAEREKLRQIFVEHYLQQYYHQSSRKIIQTFQKFLVKEQPEQIPLEHCFFIEGYYVSKNRARTMPYLIIRGDSYKKSAELLLAQSLYPLASL